MRIYVPSVDLMADMEARQDELLRRLDELNIQIERVLVESGAPALLAELATSIPLAGAAPANASTRKTPAANPPRRTG